MKFIQHYLNKEHLIIIFIVILFYGNILNNNYSLDDSFVTQKNNITASGLKSIPRILKSPYIDGNEGFKFDYRPIVKISFAIEHELFGVSPKTSHLINISLYIIGLIILLKVLKILFFNLDSRVPLFSVLLFAILPIHTEVVSSIKNRDVLLCFIFSLLALKNTLQFYESTPRKWKHLIYAIVFLYIALLSKYDALPYIAIIPMCVFIKHQKGYQQFILLFILCAFIFIFIKITRKNVLDSEVMKRHSYFFENPLYLIKDIKLKLITAVNVLGFYIQQCVFPYKMCCYYGFDTIPYNKISLHGYVGIISIPILIYYFIKSFFQKEFLLFIGIFIFTASISMYLNLVKPAVGIVADRFAFFGSLGIVLIAMHFVSKYLFLKLDKKKYLIILSCVVVAICLYITITRNNDWKDQKSIIEADVEKYPNNVYLNYLWAKQIVKHSQENSNIISSQQQKNNFLNAKAYLEKSINSDNKYPNSLNFMSYVLVYLLNDFQGAIPYIDKSLQIRETAELLYYKGICKWELKQNDSCEYFLLKSIKKDSVFYNSYGFLLYNYSQDKAFDKSLQVLNKAIERGVKSVEIYNLLGKTYWQTNNNQLANKYYNLALEIDPSNQEAIKMEKATAQNN